MAIGCLRAFNDLGVKVPEDVKIIGFDNTTHAAASVPQLTTIDQEIFRQGYEAGQFMYEILTNKTKDDFRIHIPKPVYRQSCGCQLTHNTANENTAHTPVNGNYSNFLTDIDNLYTLFDMVRASNSLKRFFYSLTYILQTSQISAMALCLYDKPLTILREDNFVLPDSINLTMFVDTVKNIEIFEPAITFNPNKKISLVFS